MSRFDVGMLLKVNETLRQIKLTIELLINIPECIKYLYSNESMNT